MGITSQFWQYSITFLIFDQQYMKPTKSEKTDEVIIIFFFMVGFCDHFLPLWMRCYKDKFPQCKLQCAIISAKYKICLFHTLLTINCEP